jgi:CelD/BcsL family acetyltransferase involved in cellulose biosynthesis
VYGIVHGGTFHYYQSGFDPAWRSKSPGLVLVGETFRDAMASGLQRYDFLHGTEEYKADWVSKQRKTCSLRLWPRGGKGAWLSRSEQASRAVRKAARSVLPEAWVESLRRLRRRAAQA